MLKSISKPSIPMMLLFIIFLIPQTGFSFNVAKYEQWANDDAAWINSIINASKGTYYECETVPFRLYFNNLTAGSHTITLEWETTKGGKHAYDYLKTYDDTESPPIGEDIANFASWSSQTYAIPSDPNIPAGIQKPGNFIIYNATITAVSGYSLSGLYTGDSNTQITITFTTTTSLPDNTNEILIVWGGHIASQADWGAGNSAVDISGAPYHMKLNALDDDAVGQRDLQISATAVYAPPTTIVTATKTADAELERTYEWTITKSVTPETWNLFEGDQGTSRFTVAVTRSISSDVVTVSGQVCVTNEGEVNATSGLKIVDHVQYQTTGDWTDVAGASMTITPAEQVMPGETACYDYTFTFNAIEGASYRNVAMVTITNYPDHLGQDYGPEVIQPFSLPTTPTTEILGSVNVDDSNHKSWLFSGSGSVSYDSTFTCDANAGVHNNTATIRETQQSDDAQVTVNCYALEIEKDASTSYNRYYSWTIDKSADQSQLANGCSQFVVNYEVVVDTLPYQDADFRVTGTITVYNPAPMAAMINSVEEVLPAATDLIVDCGVTFPYSLEAGGSMNCSYHGDLPDATNLVNTAEVALQNYAYDYEQNATENGETTYSAQAKIIFGSPTDEIDECVDVSDDNLTPPLLGTVCVADAPDTFKYSKTFGPYNTPLSFTHENIASFITNDRGETGRDNWMVSIDVTCSPSVITAQKTAETELKRTYEWMIDKSVAPDVWHLFKGDEGTSLFTVQVTRSIASDSVTVSGQVCVSNDGQYPNPTENLTIFDHAQYKTPDMNDWADISNASITITPVEQLGPYDEECYAYSFKFEAIPDAEYRNVALVTVTNFYGHMGEPYGVEVIELFALPVEPTTEVLAMIHVDDTNGQSWEFTGTGSVNYPMSFSCDSDAGVHNNTATIRETQQSDDAQVTVNCYALDIEKDVKTSYNRYYFWTIDKMADQYEMDLKACIEAEVNYKVIVDSSYLDEDFSVTGKIRVHNPAPIPAMINSLADTFSGPGSVEITVDCGVTFPFLLDAGGTMECTYSADLPSAVKRENMAMVTLQNFIYHMLREQIVSEPTGTIVFSDTADVIFGDPTDEIDECVKVDDTNLDPTFLGEVCVADAPKTFAYSLTVGPYYATDTYFVKNTAKFVTNDTQTEGSDGWKLVIHVACEPAIADFTAEPNSGTSPLTVQFKSLSTNAAKWFWDFGDGSTSTEENPVHTYYNPPRKHYNVTLTVWDCCNEFEDSMTRIDFVKVMIPADVEFSAYPIVGPPELEVQFVNRSGGVATHWLWTYGDGQADNFMHDVRFAIDPVHKYRKEGLYTVSLEGWGPGGSDKMIASNLVYVDSYYVALEFVEGGETLPGESWEDAIDHDVMSTDASMTAISGDAWAIFRFADESTKMIHKVRLLANNIFGTAYVNQLAKDFELWVSMDGVNFTPGFINTLDSKFGWHEFAFDPIEAKFVKLVLLNARGAHSPYVTLHEFQLFGETKVTGKAKFLVTIQDESSNIVAVPTEYGLGQNYPNPFNPETMIQFQLPEEAAVQLAIYNIRGQLIMSLVDERKAAGYHQVVWKGIDATGAPVGSGIYFYTIRATNDQSDVFSVIRKMTLIK